MASIDGLVLRRMSATEIGMGAGMCAADDGSRALVVDTAISGTLAGAESNQVYSVWLKQTSSSTQVVFILGVSTAVKSTTNERWRRIGRVFTDASGTIVPFIVTGANNDRRYQFGGAYTDRLLKESSTDTWTTVPGGKWILGGNAVAYTQVSSTADHALVRTSGSAAADILVVGSVVVGVTAGAGSDLLEFQQSGSGTTQVFITGLEEII